MTGQMYKVKARWRGMEDDDFIVMENLTNVVCLVNCRTNDVHWVTKHVLSLEYTLKQLTNPTKEV